MLWREMKSISVRMTSVPLCIFSFNLFFRFKRCWYTQKPKYAMNNWQHSLIWFQIKNSTIFKMLKWSSWNSWNSWNFEMRISISGKHLIESRYLTMMWNRKTQVIKFQLFNLKRLRCDDVQGRLRHFIKCLEERKTLQSCSCSPNFSFISVFFSPFAKVHSRSTAMNLIAFPIIVVTRDFKLTEKKY